MVKGVGPACQWQWARAARQSDLQGIQRSKVGSRLPTMASHLSDPRRSVVYDTGQMASRDVDGRHQVVAAMLVTDRAVLLCHRSTDRQWYPDTWDLPGGHIEPDETPQEALARELREELGITIVEPLGHHSFSRTTEEYELRVWITGRWTGSPSNCAPHEHNEIDWFTAEDVLSLQFADPGYCFWIAEALGSGDAVAGRQPDRE
jgi:8-oxo-dGTP diphosphatase